MLGYMVRAAKAGLAKVGEPSLLRGEVCGRVNLQRGVELVTGVAATEQDNYVGVFDLVTIDNDFAPRVGDILTHPDGSFRLDRRHHDNGVVSQFIVIGHDPSSIRA